MQTKSPELTPSLGVGLENASADVNLLHMKLIHHFITVTADTLIFGEHIWQRDVMMLSFKVSTQADFPAGCFSDDAKN